MSTPATPQVPPRPARSSNKAPEIPPRPMPKRLESPSRSFYPQSPFNEPHGRERLSEPSEPALPSRPPSVTIPALGEEGSEYADLQSFGETAPLAQVASDSSTQTRHIGGNLPMHAPKPSLPSSSARAQVQAVTRTDSSQAAAHGLSKNSHDDGEPLGRIKSRSSFSRPGSSSSSIRRDSIQYDEEQGPAEIGLRVPINPYLGDVQAPTPALEVAHTHSGPGERKRHSRTKSGREIFLPPDSYGLHGHGVVTTDKFEKDWYAKHPDALQKEKEKGYYHGIGSGRGESALSSEELNKLVRDTPSRGAGYGASSSIPAYPDEQIGYLASEQYSSRAVTPQTTGGGLYKQNSNISQPAVESPLRKMSFPADILAKQEFNHANSGASDKALESEVEDEPVHVNDPNYRFNKVTGGQKSIDESGDFAGTGEHNEDGGWADENGYSVPILASDEVAKEIGGEHLQPAVPPRERRGSAYDEYRSGDHTPASRPSSRPGSIHGVSGLSRYISRPEDLEHVSTPLEDVEEYEPLFPEDEGSKKPLTAAERFKMRPDALKHRFPSQDIWEDAPTSHLHEATVSTPDVPAEEQKLSRSSTFETPEQERARKGEASEVDKAKLIPKEERLAKTKLAPHLRDEIPGRPGMQNRFPSQDIWEDSPDSSHLVTTVNTPAAEDAQSPVDAQPKPNIPSRPVNRSKLGEQATEPSVPPIHPDVPARPPKRLHQVPPADAKLSSLEKTTSPVEGKKAPVLPDKPKPQVPTRPARKDSADSLTKTVSATSAGSVGNEDTTGIKSPPVAKAKPAVPARPIGSNIASLRAGFMSDLNKRLQLGPQGPPPKEKESEPEQETEKAPLSDARKGRARGPQRRKPAASPSETGTEALTTSFQILNPKSTWEISNEDDLVKVHTSEDISLPEVSERRTTGDAVETPKALEAKENAANDIPPSLALPISTNTAGESIDPSIPTADATPSSEKTDPLDKSPATLGESLQVEEEDVTPSPLSKEIGLPEPEKDTVLKEHEISTVDDKVE